MLNRLPSPRSLVVTNLLVALWIVLTGNLTFFSQVQAFSGLSGWQGRIFLLTTALLLTAYLGTLLQWLTWGRAARPVLTVLLMASALCAFFVDTFGVGIDGSQIQNMMETDLHEVMDLLSWRMLGYVVLIGGVPCWWLWRRPLREEGLWIRQKHRLVASLAGLVVIAGIAAGFYADYASLFRNHREVRLVINPQNYLAGLRSHFRHDGPLMAQPLLPFGRDAHRLMTVSTAKPTLFVLVVGETARAESFGLNGYARNTTPELARRQVINFRQVSSCGTATAVSVPCMFSGFTRADYEPQIASHREGLLDILQRAGYRVGWIDNNSGCKGVCDRVENVPLLASRKTAWCQGGECLDDLLVDTLADHLARTPAGDRVIVLHQKGSHGPAYSHRYPTAFARYAPTCDTSALQTCSRQQLINSYDNSIAYTDHVLARVIDLLGTQADRYQTAFLYISDHGESTGEHGLYLHGAPYMIAPSQQTHVPMVAWLSPEFSRSMGDGSACLARQANQPLSQDNLFPSLLGLLRVRTETYRPALDMSIRCGKRQLAQQTRGETVQIR